MCNSQHFLIPVVCNPWISSPGNSRYAKLPTQNLFQAFPLVSDRKTVKDKEIEAVKQLYNLNIKSIDIHIVKMEFLVKYCLVLILCFQLSTSVILDEALRNPSVYIRYDNSNFNTLLHVGLALLLCYSILIFLWCMINLIFKLHGQKRLSRTYD